MQFAISRELRPPVVKEASARYRTGSGSDRIQALNFVLQVFLPAKLSIAS